MRTVNLKDLYIYVDKGGVKELRRYFLGNVPLGARVLIYGNPGVGKTFFVLSLAKILSKRYRVLFVSLEEGEVTLAKKLKRLRFLRGNIDFVFTSDIAVTDYDVVIVDSINYLQCDIANLDRERLWILVGQVTKEGKLAGRKKLEHDVDVIAELRDGRLVIQKNRYGDVKNVMLR